MLTWIHETGEETVGARVKGTLRARPVSGAWVRSDIGQTARETGHCSPNVCLGRERNRHVNSWPVSASEWRSEQSQGGAEGESGCFFSRDEASVILLLQSLTRQPGLSHIVGQPLLASLLETHFFVSLRRLTTRGKCVDGDPILAWQGLGTQPCLCKSMNAQLLFWTPQSFVLFCFFNCLKNHLWIDVPGASLQRRLYSASTWSWDAVAAVPRSSFTMATAQALAPQAQAGSAWGRIRPMESASLRAKSAH